MQENIVAFFDGKVLHPKKALNLEYNHYYLLNIKPVEKSANPIEDDPAFDIAALAVKTGIPDLASNHDYYLYGKPKRNNKAKANVK